MVTVDITDLKEGEVKQQTTNPSPEELDLDPDMFSNVEVTLTLQKAQEKIDVSFDARAVATLQGDRTLRWYEEPVTGSFALTLRPSQEMSEDDRDDEHVRSYSPFDPEIDLTQEIRDTLLLAVPLRRIAPGGEEEELQLEYGQPDDEAADMPEWKRKLKNLRDENDHE